MKHLLFSLLSCLLLTDSLQAQETISIPLKNTDWRILPHANVISVGGRYMHFDDSLAYQTLYAPKSNIKHRLSHHTYVQSDKAILLNGCIGKFHTQDTIYLTNVETDSLTDIFVRVDRSEIDSLEAMTQPFESLVFNFMMQTINMDDYTHHIINEEAGSLGMQLIETSALSLKQCEKIVIAGPLNGDDIAMLYHFFGSNCTFPNIKTLDLSKAWVVSDTVPWSYFKVNFTHDSFLKENGIRYREPASYHCEHAITDSIEVVLNDYGYLYEEIPDSLYFRRDTSLKGHIMRYSLESLPYIEHLLLPINTTHIDYAALAYCENLQEITLPRSVRFVRAVAFAHCKKMHTVHISDDSPLLKSDKFLPNPDNTDNPFFGCSSDLKLETYPSVPPMVTFHIHGKTRLNKVRIFDQYRVCPVSEAEVKNGEFSAEVTAPKHALVTVGNGNMAIIAEEGADLWVDIDNHRVKGGPLNDLYDEKLNQINKWCKDVRRTEVRIQSEWREDSITALRSLKEYYQNQIGASIIDASRKYSSWPIAPYLLFACHERLTPNQQLVMLITMNHENASNPAIRNGWRRIRERYQQEEIDWDNWADATRMKMVKVHVAGKLSSCIDSTFVKDINKRLSISGKLNEEDFRWLNEFIKKNDIRALDLSQVKISSIPDNAFSFNNTLRYICLPKQVRTIGIKAFFDCGRLKQIILPEQLNTIGEMAFSHCAQLYHIDLPASLRTIEDRGFNYCLNLKQVDLPDGLQTLGEYVFAECEYLERIRIPASVSNIGIYALKDCPEVEVRIDPNNLSYYCVNNQIVGKTQIAREQLHQY